MKLTAEVDLVLGILVGTGRRRLGFGLRIQRKKVVKKIGVDLGEKRVKRFRVFVLKNTDVSSWNWNSIKTSSVKSKQEEAMKRSNVFSMLLQMMPSSLHASSKSPEHWEFLEDIDAPQWVDLAKEATMMGTQGDHPWFQQRHSHHEVSLARAENLPFVFDESLTEKPQQPIKKKVELGKGTVAKLVKPSFKANAMKACLGGMQRVSNAGSKDARRSSRPRLTNQWRPRTPKKIHLQRSGSQKMAAKTAVGRSDPKSAVSGREPNAVKDTSDANVKKLRLMENKGHRIAHSGIGRNTQTRQQLVASPLDGSKRIERCKEVSESPKSSVPMYPLPSPPGGTNSSPSDMAFSSAGSQRSSNSSQESPILTPSALTSRKELLAERNVGEVRLEPKHGASQELPLAPLSTVMTEFREPSIGLPGTADLHERDSRPDRKNTSNIFTLDRDRKQRTPTPRLKRRSIGPPLRVKQIERAASSSAKKNVVAVVVDRQDVGKESGTQATHPILEKLRKSWGSALRVRQRQEIESATGLSTTDDRQRSDGVSDQKEANNIKILQGNSVINNLVRSDLDRWEQPEGAAIQFSEELTGRKSNVSPEMIIPCEETARATKVGSSGRRNGSVSTSGIFSKSTATDAVVGKTSAAPGPKVGLAKMQPNQQRPKHDVGSMFIKQYAFPETGVSKSLRANKENMEMRFKSQYSPPPQEQRRKPQTVGPRSVIPRQTRSAASAQVGSTQTRIGLQSVPLPTRKTTELGCRPTRPTGSTMSGSSSVQKSELADTRLSNSGNLKGSAVSVPKLVNQKLEISSTLTKESISNGGRKGCKNGSRVTDESIAVQSQKFKIPTKSEPAIPAHNVKSIREWEIKSGRRYHDLQPSERQTINQQITAASKAMMSRRPTA